MSGRATTLPPLRILLIGFSTVVGEGLRAILVKDAGISVTGHCGNGHEGLLEIRRASGNGQNIDVVLTETRNGQLDGVQATRQIKEAFPEVAILVLTDFDNDANVIDAIHAGAGGYLFLKDLTPEVLLQSIHRVVEGGTQIKTELLHKAVAALIQNGRKTLAERTAEAAHLTAREVDVLRIMGNGESNKAIASELNISLDTTKKHIQTIVSKLGARSRTHAAIIAAQAGIVGTPVTLTVPLETWPA